jgi:hypothetical protein
VTAERDHRICRRLRAWSGPARASVCWGRLMSPPRSSWSGRTPSSTSSPTTARGSPSSTPDGSAVRCGATSTATGWSRCATWGPTWSRSTPPRRLPRPSWPGPGGPARGARRSSAPRTRSRCCGPGWRSTGHLPGSSAGTSPTWSPGHRRPSRATRWCGVRPRRTRGCSTRRASRCTPRRWASPRRSTAARTSTARGSTSWSAGAGRSPASRTDGCCSRRRWPARRPAPARSRASTSIPSCAARGWPPPAWRPWSTPACATSPRRSRST